MSLPIIRLCIVDSNRAIRVEDPAAASCSLYTFLRAIPSEVECAMAFEDFRRSVQTGRSPSYFSRSNARVLNLIDAAVTDTLLRRSPKVIPALARASSTWRNLLVGEAKAAAAPCSSSASPEAMHSPQELQSGAEGCVRETIPVGSMQNFQSPYESPRRRSTHPLLLEAVQRVRAAAPAVEDERDRREREFATLMESRAAALRTKLQSAIANIPSEETECVRFVQQLQLRAAAAERLFAVQRYEEVTMQTAEGVLRLEIATMRTLLSRIVDVIAETEDRHERDGPHAPFYAEECRLMAAFHTALNELPS